MKRWLQFNSILFILNLNKHDFYDKNNRPTSLYIIDNEKGQNFTFGYFNFDLKKLSHLDTINSNIPKLEYGFEPNQCEKLKQNYSDFILLMNFNDWIDNKLINFKDFSVDWENLKKKAINIDKHKYFTWNELVQFYMYNQPLYIFKFYKKFEFSNINSLDKLSHFYYLYTCCLLKDPKFTKKSSYYLLFGNQCPKPCLQDGCEISGYKQSVCFYNPMSVFNNDYRCSCDNANIALVNASEKCDAKNLRRYFLPINCSEPYGVSVVDPVRLIYVCKCNPGYTGLRCMIKQNPCFELNDTKKYMLNNKYISSGNSACRNGKCINFNEHGFKCKCNSNYAENSSLPFPNCMKRVIKDNSCYKKCINGYCVNSNLW